MGHPKPPCHLLILQGVTLAHKGLTPSGKIAHLLFDSLNVICIFKLFQELTTTVMGHSRKIRLKMKQFLYNETFIVSLHYQESNE
jgi:hypothetical protein